MIDLILEHLDGQVIFRYWNIWMGNGHIIHDLFMAKYFENSSCLLRSSSVAACHTWKETFRKKSSEKQNTQTKLKIKRQKQIKLQRNKYKQVSTKTKVYTLGRQMELDTLSQETPGDGGTPHRESGWGKLLSCNYIGRLHLSGDSGTVHLCHDNGRLHLCYSFFVVILIWM